MFFGKKNKDVRLTDKQYKDLTSNMSKRERREFDRRQDELKREREATYTKTACRCSFI